MKLRYQALSAVSATALLIAASAGLLTLAGTATSVAEPINPAVRSALSAAVAHPSQALQALIDQMNSEVPGSGAKFAAAFSDRNTDALASALSGIAAGNAALQQTIESALSTLSQEPQLASVTVSGGKTVNAATVVTAIDTAMLNQTQTYANNKTNNSQGSDHHDDKTAQNGSNGCQTSDPNCLQNLNPGAGPFNFGQFGSPINSPFTRGNPNQNYSQNTGFSPVQNNTNSGRPNSRS